MWKEISNNFKRLLGSRFGALFGGNGYFYNQHNLKGLGGVLFGSPCHANMPNFTSPGC
jgi:hypothetical protein